MANRDKQSTLGDTGLLARIADALERLAPPPIGTKLPDGDAFVWEPVHGGLLPVDKVASVPTSG